MEISKVQLSVESKQVSLETLVDRPRKKFATKVAHKMVMQEAFISCSMDFNEKSLKNQVSLLRPFMMLTCESRYNFVTEYIVVNILLIYHKKESIYD